VAPGATVTVAFAPRGDEVQLLKRPGTFKDTAARLVSILAHPVLAMAVATVISAGGAGMLRQALVPVAAALAGVMLYSAFQVRSGRWAHIDASGKQERSQLNVFASGLLIGLAALLALVGMHPAIVAAIGLSGSIVLSAHLLRRHLKSSLHVAFVLFAACIVWPHAVASGALLAAGAAVAWSRLVLERHVLRDLLAGAAIGLVAGVAFQVIVNR
jgi:hypothetical protein